MEGYKSNNVTGEIELRPIETFINASDVVMYYRDGTRFWMALFDENKKLSQVNINSKALNSVDNSLLVKKLSINEDGVIYYKK